MPIGIQAEQAYTSTMSAKLNRLLGTFIGVIVVIALILVFSSNMKRNQEFETGSPQWVVQSYLTAMIDGDTDRAIEFISESSPCKVIHLDRAWVQKNINVSLSKVSINGTTARVEVAVEFGTSDLFSSPYSENHIYRLEQKEQEWLITGIPWPVYDCGVVSK